MNNEFKKLSQGNVTRYVLENASSGGTSSGSVASVSMPMGGTRKRGDNLIAQEADKNTVPASTPRNFVAKNAKSSGAGAHKDKSKTIPRKEKHKKPYMEDHSTATGGWGQGSYDTYTTGNHGRGVAEDEEYDDEAGMADNNIETMKRAVDGLDSLIHKGDNLPEWCQEKIAVAKSMLVTVWDYMASEEQGVAEGSTDLVQIEYWQQETMESGRWVKTKPIPRATAEKIVNSFERGEIVDVEQGVAEGSIQQLPTRDADYSEYNTNHLKMMLRPGILHRNEARFKSLIRQELKKREQQSQQGVAEGKEDKIEQLKQDYATAVHWSKNEKSPQKREAARQKAEKIKAHLEKQYKQGVSEGSIKDIEAKIRTHDQRKADREQAGDPYVAHEIHSHNVIRKQLLDKRKRAQAAYQKKMDQQDVAEEWSQKYKSSINCSHPKGFSQKAHCAGKKKYNESVEMEMVCPDCGMCQTHGNNMMEIRQRLDAKCWTGKHKEGTKIKGGVRVNNCVPNEDIAEVAPKGWEGTVKAMKKHKDIDNPWALAWSMKNKGYKSHKNESVDPYFESLDNMLERQLEPTMDLDTWNNNFQNADPNKYHQFKNKTPEKKK